MSVADNIFFKLKNRLIELKLPSDLINLLEEKWKAEKNIDSETIKSYLDGLENEN